MHVHTCNCLYAEALSCIHTSPEGYMSRDVTDSLQIGLHDYARRLHLKRDNCRSHRITIAFMFAGVPPDALTGVQRCHAIPDRWLSEEEDGHSQEDKPNQAHDISSSCDWVECERAEVQGRDSGHGHCQQRPQGHTSSTTCDKGCTHTHTCQHLLLYKSDGSMDLSACYYTQSCGHDTNSNADSTDCSRPYKTLKPKP